MRARTDCSRRAPSCIDQLLALIWHYYILESASNMGHEQHSFGCGGAHLGYRCAEITIHVVARSTAGKLLSIMLFRPCFKEDAVPASTDIHRHPEDR